MLPWRAPALLFAISFFAPKLAADAPPPWAYGFKEPPPPGTAQVSPGKAGSLSPNPEKLSLPDSARTFTRAEITNPFSTADWYPDDHPAMPDIVARGKAPDVWSCARCHYTNGKGRPENADIAGLPVSYFIEQLLAFRSGERLSSDPRKPNTLMMVAFAKAMTDEEIKSAAEYYGAIKRTPWIRVVETDRAPKTALSAGMYLPIANGGDEPLGDRIVEVPEDANAVEIQRSPRIGFVAYSPLGSIKRGEELVTQVGSKTVTCATCHGADFKGMTLPEIGDTPGLAGRSPSYLVRQLFDIKSGRRHSKRTESMKPVVANLTPDDMLAIAAYLASRAP